MKAFLTFTFALAFFCLLVASTAVGQAVPQLINVQGKLTDAVGDPVADGPYPVTFSIYDVVTGGTALWHETRTVTVSDGLFSISLGVSTPIPPSLFDNTDLWLGIKVDTDPEMAPRQRLTTSPYAFRAAGSSVGGWVDDGTVVRLETASDFVGIGTATPGYELEVVAADATAARFSNTGTADNYTVKAINTSGTCAIFQAGSVSPFYPTIPVAVFGTGYSSYNGGWFRANGSGQGLIGQTAGSGDAIEGWAYGVSARYSGYFHGGLGVYIDGDATVTDTIHSTSGGFKFPDGTVQTTAAVYGGPIAYGVINLDGTVASGTPNISSSWNGTSSRYEITISGETYIQGSYVTVVTVLSSDARMATTSSVSGNLLVFVFNSSGTAIQDNFHFVTYKP